MPKLKNIPFQFKNEVVNDKTVLTLSGVVGKPYPWEDETDTINEKLIENALSGVDGDIHIRLNSQGGDVFEGISICNFLKSLDNHVTIEVTALAASAASIIAMGADKVIMDKGSSMMVHEASTIAWGNKQDIQKTLNALETIDKSLISIYQTKTGLDEQTINDFLIAETWFTAQEAVEKGFADEIGNFESEKETGKDSGDSIEINDNGIKIISNSINLDGMVKQITAKVKEQLKEEQQEPKPQNNLLKNFLGGIN
ncbi:head maturation protease, ClpP-related [Facklamia sp. P12945]|uniref:head maturation protease, ClpP-related n=1 Tax=Facklamia sp. P12945 TaxID=3421950 RepID=UPI003D178E35